MTKDEPRARALSHEKHRILLKPCARHGLRARSERSSASAWPLAHAAAGAGIARGIAVLADYFVWNVIVAVAPFMVAILAVWLIARGLTDGSSHE